MHSPASQPHSEGFMGKELAWTQCPVLTSPCQPQDVGDSESARDL